MTRCSPTVCGGKVGVEGMQCYSPQVKWQRINPALQGCSCQEDIIHFPRGSFCTTWNLICSFSPSLVSFSLVCGFITPERLRWNGPAKNPLTGTHSSEGGRAGLSAHRAGVPQEPEPDPQEWAPHPALRPSGHPTHPDSEPVLATSGGSDRRELKVFFFCSYA